MNIWELSELNTKANIPSDIYRLKVAKQYLHLLFSCFESFPGILGDMYLYIAERNTGLWNHTYHI